MGEALSPFYDAKLAPFSVTNCRPVSKLPFTSKIFSKFIAKQLKISQGPTVIFVKLQPRLHQMHGSESKISDIIFMYDMCADAGCITYIHLM